MNNKAYVMSHFCTPHQNFRQYALFHQSCLSFSTVHWSHTKPPEIKPTQNSSHSATVEKVMHCASGDTVSPGTLGSPIFLTHSR